MGYERSIVEMITGARGSGKSLFLTAVGTDELLRGKTVWSNMPIKLSNHIAKKYGSPRLESKPLDLDAFYALSEDLQNGVVLIDEAQNMGDSRASLSLKNRLLNAIVAQVRKRSLNVHFTVQESNWVDVRLRFAADVEVECFDLAYSPWGINKHVGYGELIRCMFKDLSGYKTGTPFFKSGRYFKRSILKGSQYWPCYDTVKVTDLEEAFTTVKLDLKQRVISNKENIDVNDDSWIDEKIAMIKSKEQKQFTGFQLSSIIGQPLTRSIKQLLASYGICYDRYSQCYQSL